MKGVPPWLSLNTAASFITNTNWQYYGGEATMSYLSQMAGLAVQNFVSAAVGMAVLAAVVRGFARRSANEIGNFWRDLYRSLVYILLPLCVHLRDRARVPGCRRRRSTATRPSRRSRARSQSIARGPAASQIAIKQLGTNGGGFYNSNSAVPFENPNGLTNFLEVLAILLIPAGQVFMFGRMVGAMKQAWAVMGAMVAIGRSASRSRFPPSSMARRCCALPGSNLSQTQQSGGNMQDKEVRFGIANTALWAVATTDASNGSVDGGHDAFTPLGGAVPLVNIFFGEVIFGGVGSGLYGMFFYILIAVFVAGLMVGRTPEYLGKKVEAREMKYAAIGALFVPTMVLTLTAHLGGHDVRTRLDLQQRGARLHRGALCVYVAEQQQRQCVRRLRRYPVRERDRAASRCTWAASCHSSPRSPSPARSGRRRSCRHRPAHSAPTGPTFSVPPRRHDLPHGRR